MKAALFQNQSWCTAPCQGLYTLDGIMDKWQENVKCSDAEWLVLCDRNMGKHICEKVLTGHSEEGGKWNHSPEMKSLSLFCFPRRRRWKSTKKSGQEELKLYHGWSRMYFSILVGRFKALNRWFLPTTTELTQLIANVLPYVCHWNHFYNLDLIFQTVLRAERHKHLLFWYSHIRWVKAFCAII